MSNSSYLGPVYFLKSRSKRTSLSKPSDQAGWLSTVTCWAFMSGSSLYDLVIRVPMFWIRLYYRSMHSFPHARNNDLGQLPCAMICRRFFCSTEQRNRKLWAPDQTYPVSNWAPKGLRFRSSLLMDSTSPSSTKARKLALKLVLQQVLVQMLLQILMLK